MLKLGIAIAEQNKLESFAPASHVDPIEIPVGSDFLNGRDARPINTVLHRVMPYLPTDILKFIGMSVAGHVCHPFNDDALLSASACLGVLHPRYGQYILCAEWLRPVDMPVDVRSGAALVETLETPLRFTGNFKSFVSDVVAHVKKWHVDKTVEVVRVSFGNDGAQFDVRGNTMIPTWKDFTTIDADGKIQSAIPRIWAFVQQPAPPQQRYRHSSGGGGGGGSKGSDSHIVRDSMIAGALTGLLLGGERRNHRRARRLHNRYRSQSTIESARWPQRLHRSHSEMRRG